ncbi:hypothetical protein HYH03_003484 [Edaphochlamys debaryana]|uniref:Uncharacterized protein n=1 Tax=Edaphochlamys debaryana TaxID=47281 RepID=A0A836C3F8_9CHLO|nr:hypothetical protein HYH03_003484 [Edaphochlamys debaryana]|eukprot:KAG2498745.1 hypothetical protein HYH03_003484 [Edaphochlamys debaryana]
MRQSGSLGRAGGTVAPVRAAPAAPSERPRRPEPRPLPPSPPPLALLDLPSIHPTALLDAACAVCCVCILASSAARRTAQAQAAPLVSSQHSAAQATFADGSPTQLIAPTTPMSQPLGGSDAVVACVLMAAVSNLAYKLPAAWSLEPPPLQRLSSSARSAPGSSAAPTTEAASRLARLEALTDKQLSEFAVAVRQIDKLQVRTRLTSGDLRRPIAQLQHSSADQAALLTRLAGETEALRGQLRDTQALLGALQGLTAKQFQVTVDAIKQLRAQKAAQGST